MPYAVSETDLLNDALAQVGESTVTGIDDTSSNGRWCKILYPPLRRAMLEMGNWHFAEHRIALGVLATAPVFEFTYQFALPGDLLRIKEFNGTLITDPNLSTPIDPVWWHTIPGKYKIEGQNLLTNESSAKIVYVRDVENPSLWTGLFYQSLAAMLAAKLYGAIKKDPNKGGAMLQQAMGLWLPQAQAVSAQMQAMIDMRVDNLIWGRW